MGEALIRVALALAVVGVKAADEEALEVGVECECECEPHFSLLDKKLPNDQRWSLDKAKTP